MIFIGTTEEIMSIMFPSRYDDHMKAYRWHQRMMQLNPNYLDDIAKRRG